MLAEIENKLLSKHGMTRTKQGDSASDKTADKSAEKAADKSDKAPSAAVGGAVGIGAKANDVVALDAKKPEGDSPTWAVKVTSPRFPATKRR